MIKLGLICALAAIALTACGPAVDHSEMAHNQHAAKAGAGVEVSSAIIHPPFQGRTTAAGFFALENTGAATRLVAAASPISETVEIHTHLREDGVMKMRRVEGVDIGTGETVIFKPGGYHLMMFNTKIDPNMTDAPLTLTYSDGTSVTLIVPIDGRSDSLQGNNNSGH